MSEYHSMFFSSNLPFTVLFDSWTVRSNTDLILSCLGLFVFGIGHEFLKKLQINFAKNGFDCLNVNETRIIRKSGSDVTATEPALKCSRDEDVIEEEKGESSHCDQSAKDSTQPQSGCEDTMKHCIDTIFHCLLLMWTYVLMLSVMTMNPAIVCSAVAGCSVGYLIFHRQPATQTPQPDKRKGETKPLTDTKKNNCLTNYQIKQEDS